jgi:hypothetical protein
MPRGRGISTPTPTLRYIFWVYAGFIVPHKEFLEGLREITKEDGALLVFDEVMTGFRIAYGGAQVRATGPKSAQKPSCG